jgi:16S rRNA (cytidine1402-2'-O)-methyltransferase
MPGCLYLVSTPIGNLGDMTLRAIRVLKKADIVAAEDPARIQPLLAHYGIETPVTSYHNQSKEEKAPVLIARMQDGQQVALIVDAGTPVIADPGAFLVTRALDAGIRVSPVPGASALLAALTVSGLPADAFLFSPLPEAPAARRRLLLAGKADRRTHVFFVPARRLRPAVEEIRDLWGNRRLTVAVNLTTSAEQVHRGSAQSLLDAAIWPVHGDATLVVEGARALRRGTKKRKKPR